MVVRRTTLAKAKRESAKKRPKRRVPSISERLAKIGEAIPAEELAKLPTDGAENLDHYIYGAPKRY